MKIKNYTIEILISTMVLLLLFYSSDPVIYKDTDRILKGNFYEPPLYHFIIRIIQSMFITFNSIVIFQTFLIGLGIIFFTKTISKYLYLNIIIEIIIALFLFLPILTFYNHLLTEPLSYAFSLFFVSFVIRLIYNFNILNLVWNSFFVVALLLMRNQFIFLYPVILFLCLGILYINKSKKKLILFIISFVSIIIIHKSLIFLYQYSNKNLLEEATLKYEGSGAFRYIYIDAIYISTIKDLEIFKDKDLQKTLTKIIEEAAKERLTMEYYNGRGHFGSSFTKITKLSNIFLNS